jgi:hypothetical protein
MPPYARVVVDTIRGKAIDGSASNQPFSPISPVDPHHYLVVHDTRGRVVVRTYHPTGAYVIGIARWNGERTVERHAINQTIPNEAQWQMIDHALHAQLAAGHADPPPGTNTSGAPWIDDAPLLKESTPEGHNAQLAREGKLARPRQRRKGAPAPAQPGQPDGDEQFHKDHPILYWIAGGILLAALVAAVVLWEIYKPKRDDGGRCTMDHDCASGRCFHDVCRPLNSHGDRCEYDSDCESHNCRHVDRRRFCE